MLMQKDNEEARLIAYFAIHEVRPVYTDRFGSSRVEGRVHGSFSVHTKDQVRSLGRPLNDRRPGYVRIFHGRLERYPTDMMIKLLDRGFAPVAIALSFVAGNGDRSGDERFNCIGAGVTAPTFPLP
jgi:hypothetical protein